MRVPRHRPSTASDLQMTAMIDVVFLLLVFFLWTSSFDTPEFDFAGELSLPPVGNAATTATSTPGLFDEVVIRIVHLGDGSDEIRFNATVVSSIDALATKLISVARLGAQPAVIVDPDVEVTMATSIAVYDAARSAGFDRVLFAVKP